MTHPQPAVSTLDRAPDEVLLEIFLHVAAVDPGHDENSFPASGPHPLLPVVQVNKRFNAVATPLLVRDWHLRPAHEGGAKFVLHLLEQPQLRSQVKSMAVDERASRNRLLKRRPRGSEYGSARRARDDWGDQSPYSTAESEQLAKTAEETYPMLACWVHGVGERSWADQIRQRSPRAIAALALAWARGLEEIDLMFDDETLFEPDSWILWLMRKTGGMLSPLEVEGRGPPLPDLFMNLRCVSMTNCDPLGVLNSVFAATCFRLPNLRVFKALAVEVAGLTLDEADTSGSGTSLQPSGDALFPNGLSGVEELYFVRCFVTANGLGVLTRSCRRLRVLALQWKWNDYLANIELSNDNIASAIRLHSASLEKILIEGSSDYDPDDLDEFDPGTLGDCLLFCDKLETLVINLERLYGREYYEKDSSYQPLTAVLPPCLTYLGLSIHPSAEGGQVTKELLLGLLHQCGPEGQFSRLQKLGLIGSSDGFQLNQEIRSLAKKNGVELVRHKGPGGVI